MSLESPDCELSSFFSMRTVTTDGMARLTTSAYETGADVGAELVTAA